MKNHFKIHFFVGILLTVLIFLTGNELYASKRYNADDYLVIASEEVRKDKSWYTVVQELQKKHQAGALFYNEHPEELLPELKEIRPRYVAIVEKPEQLNRDFIIRVHQLSRKIDEDIFADFLWGVITGYDAGSALKMVNNSTEPFVIRDAVASITELKSAKWFDRYGWVDDHQKGLWGEKQEKGGKIETDRIDEKEVLKKFTDLYEKYRPDLVVTAAHATEKNLEMPFSLGNIKSRDGVLYAEDRFTKDTWPLVESGKRKVYFAVGNCLIGNIDNTKESMAVAWMNSGNAATMIGYTVLTWHGRNGWGGLKYWLTTPGRYTLAEAVYLNQQDFLHQQGQWNPVFLTENYPHQKDFNKGWKEATDRLSEALGDKPTKDQLGFWHDRDVLAYYGDPKWDVRLQEIEQEKDFTIRYKKNKGRIKVIIKTKRNFNLNRMKGDGFKEEHVLDLPFSCFFPERLNNPRLAPGQIWNAAIDENFLLLYDPSFVPGKSYTVILDTDD
ncbi:MAG: hypothetical protein LBQ60_17500 [Bacteroidales bacterium]|nr:hypothetical protein [Bacteroidales bacterium]